jgi:hypothetical protein
MLKYNLVRIQCTAQMIYVLVKWYIWYYITGRTADPYHRTYAAFLIQKDKEFIQRMWKGF